MYFCMGLEANHLTCEEHRFEVFENMVRREYLAQKKDEKVGEWKEFPSHL
jgi:hypothetical protein